MEIIKDDVDFINIVLGSQRGKGVTSTGTGQSKEPYYYVVHSRKFAHTLIAKAAPNCTVVSIDDLKNIFMDGTLNRPVVFDHYIIQEVIAYLTKEVDDYTRYNARLHAERRQIYNLARNILNVVE